MLDLTPEEHQQLVLMVGSKKEWQTYLGLTDPQSRSTWIELKLKSPADYVRSLTTELITQLLAVEGSYTKLAPKLGVSDSFLKAEIKSRCPSWFNGDPKWELEECIELFDRYRSVKLISHMTSFSETQIRKAVNALDLDISLLIDYSFGGNSNAKGRRAELEWAQTRGNNILADRNLIDGSQADWDFDDAEFGKVNVKSSRRYKYKAQTRKASPHFWKISCSGIEKCDYVAAMLYSDDMQTLIGMKMIPTAQMPLTKSLVLLKEHIEVV